MPFGLQIHMLAAHGNNSAAYEREAKRISDGPAPKPKKWAKGGRNRPRPGAKQRLKHPRLSKLS